MAACKVEVCRICFAMDCQLHLLHEDMKLYKAYEAVTELVLADEEDLPPYLCTSCAYQLMSCARFRHRSLQAHLMLLDILKNHDRISVESIQAFIKTTHCDSNKKYTEEERTLSNIKIEIKCEDIPEDPIATELSDNIKTEYIPDVVADDELVRDEAVVAPCVETNSIVKEEVVLEVPVNDNVDDGKLETVFKMPSENVVDCTKNDCNQNKGVVPKVKTTPKTTAERSRLYRLRKKQLALAKKISANEVVYTPSTSNSRMTFEPSPQPATAGEDGSLQEDELNMVEAKEGMEVNGNLSLRNGIQQQGMTVNKKLLQNLFSNLSSYENSSEIQFSSPLQSHANTTLHCCYLCDFKTDTNESILAHMTLHGTYIPTPSDVTKRSYIRKSPQINNLSNDFSCDICKKSFPRKNAFKRHMLIHTDRKQYACDVCGKSFRGEIGLKRHVLLQACHKRYSCDMCDKVYTKKCSLQIHLQSHAGVKPFTCNICKNSFTTSSGLKGHMLLHTDDKQYSCDKCDRSYSQKGSLQYHLQTHLSDKPITCDICSKSFRKKGYLQTHMLIHTGDKPHSCDVCKKPFREKGNLQKHMLIHSEGGPYKCDVCDKTFLQENTLKLHSRQHTGRKPFKCEICSKSFGLKFCWKNHMLIHSGNKSHTCDVCGKSFLLKTNLQRHLLRHVEEKPFKCDLCDKSFRIKYSLKIHVMTHSGERR